MKFTIVLVAILGVAAAQYFGYASPPPPPYRVSTIAPVISVNRAISSDQNANVVRYDNDISPDGSYRYIYETDNGIAAQEQGVPREFSGNPPVRPVVAQGSYSYTSPEGIPIVISYIADENGYQPSGDSIPTPPPIPEAIARAIDYIAKNPSAYQKKK